MENYPYFPNDSQQAPNDKLCISLASLTKVLVPLVNPMLFLACLICTLSADMLSADMLRDMLVASCANTSLVLAENYRKGLKRELPKSSIHSFDPEELADFIIERLDGHQGDEAEARFRELVEIYRKEGVLPEDFDERCKEIVDFFKSCYEASDAADGYVASALRLPILAEWCQSKSGITAALSAAVTELIEHIVRELPAILKAFHKEKTGVEVMDGVIRMGMEAIAAGIGGGKLFALLMGKGDVSTIDPAGWKKNSNVSFLDMFGIYFGGKDRTYNGSVAMACGLYSIELHRLKAHNEACGSLYKEFRVRSYTKEFLRDVIINDGLTGEQLLSFISAKLLVLFGINLPVSMHEELRHALEREGVLYGSVYDNMPLHRSEDPFEGRCHFIKTAVSKKKQKTRKFFEAARAAENKADHGDIRE